MRPSLFNIRVPLPHRDEVFLMNTLTDGQVVVSGDVIGLLDRLAADPDAVWQTLSATERETLEVLAEHGFLVPGLEEERAALDAYFAAFREDATELRVTVLTTLQCNFACDYCIQGDHGQPHDAGGRMTLDTAALVAAWIESRLDAVRPERFVLTFFGGEPLANLPVVRFLAERLWAASQARGVHMLANLITNGLLLSGEVVDQLLPYGLSGVKVTLDGHREAHDRMRPLRGGQGTFDRIVGNLREVAGRVAVTIGGNFDASTVETFPELLRFLSEQPFADAVAKVNFKPIIRRDALRSASVIPLADAGADRMLYGACMSAAGPGGSPCDTCHFVDEHMTWLREETRRHGFATSDGVHMGPCELHRRHAHAIGPDGSIFACPGFADDPVQAVGHVARHEGQRHRDGAALKFERIAAWRRCGDCAFIPVCGGGCTVAAHHELGDMQAPACHRGSLESALVSLAYETAGTSGKEVAR